jgi:hypothetical protein
MSKILNWLRGTAAVPGTVNGEIQPPEQPKAPAQEKPLTIIFCLPGDSFPREFLIAWTELVAYCMTHNIRPILSTQHSCNIYYARNMCLGGNVLRGEDQKPFNGEIKYDYFMWIDSDVIFSVPQFVTLLESAKKNPVVSGIYRMTDGNYAAVEKWDNEFFKKNGHFQFLSDKDIVGKSELIPVAYSGMGFMIVKRGVFEALKYPWFKQLEKRIGDAVDMTMEDVSFCLRATRAGYRVMVDPRVRPAHRKAVMI